MLALTKAAAAAHDLKSSNAIYGHGVFKANCFTDYASNCPFTVQSLTMHMLKKIYWEAVLCVKEHLTPLQAHPPLWAGLQPP